MSVSMFRKLILCPLQRCPFCTNSDDTGCWGECIHCGKRSGFVDSATLRAFCDAQLEQSMARSRDWGFSTAKNSGAKIIVFPRREGTEA